MERGQYHGMERVYAMDGQRDQNESVSVAWRVIKRRRGRVTVVTGTVRVFSNAEALPTSLILNIAVEVNHQTIMN
jgi:hypothetical protein